MKLTCLSKGSSFYNPPCHVLDLAGFTILLDCPLDLAALSVFHPPNLRHHHQHQNRSDLIHDLPRYKPVLSLLSDWDPSLIDVVLISSPMAMLGLPFLTRNPRFSGKVYATEGTAKFGRLAMEELVAMHAEYVGFYGPDEEGVAEWMKPEEVAGLPEELRDVVMGKEGEMCSWLPLYSAHDLRECWKKIQNFKYGENCTYNGSLIFTPFCSGLEIGTSNWTICGTGRSVTYLASSIFRSSYAAGFDYQDIQGNDIIIFSDFSCLYEADNFNTIAHDMQDGSGNKDCHAHLPFMGDPCSSDIEIIKNFLSSEEDEQEKICFISSCIVDSVRKGGSVLIPMGRQGAILQLLEQISQSLEQSDLKVPIYMISSTAEEMLALVSVMPEWVSKERLEKFYSGEPLFGFSKLIKERKLHLFPSLHSPSLISAWHEPCIVFSPHWSFRLGSSVHLLNRWSKDKNSLLVLEEGFNADITLSPFTPVNLKVLKCSFHSGPALHTVVPLLKLLKPKLVLLPTDFHKLIPSEDCVPFSFLFYEEDCPLSVPKLKQDTEVYLSKDVIFQHQPQKLSENMAIVHLQGQLVLRDAKFLVLPSRKSVKDSH